MKSTHMEIITEIYYWIFSFSDDLFDFATKNGRKSYYRVFIAVGIYILNIIIFLIFFLINLSMMKVLIGNFQINWDLLLLALFMLLAVYFGRNVVDYTFQLLSSRK